MRSFALTYLAVLVAFVGIDAIWLGVVAGDLYKREMGQLMTDRPVWWAAGLFYLVYVAGIVGLAIPEPQAGWGRALLQGALFGLCAYATYDLTNLAVVRGWPLRLTLVDLAWGTALTACVTVIGFLLRSRLA
ncbi:MAG: DUF2177 family protein [Reyranellaceae bacterium]